MGPSDPIYPLHGSNREPDVNVEERAREFIAWLRARPEREVHPLPSPHPNLVKHAHTHILKYTQNTLNYPQIPSITLKYPQIPSNTLSGSRGHTLRIPSQTIFGGTGR